MSRCGSSRALSVHSSELESSPTFSIQQQHFTFPSLLHKESEPAGCAVYQRSAPSDCGHAEILAKSTIIDKVRPFLPSSCQLDVSANSQFTTNSSFQSVHPQETTLATPRSFTRQEMYSASRHAFWRGSFSRSHREVVTLRTGESCSGGSQKSSESVSLHDWGLWEAQLGNQDFESIETVVSSTGIQVLTLPQTQVGMLIPKANTSAPAEKIRKRSITKADMYFMEEFVKLEQAAKERRQTAGSLALARELQKLSRSDITVSTQSLPSNPDLQNLSDISRGLLFTDAAHVVLERRKKDSL